MELKTQYMGLTLKNPLVPSASPMSRDLGLAKQLEDAGAAAVVMYSLFEEQINQEVNEIDQLLTAYNESYFEALSYLPEPETFENLEADEYLNQVVHLKEALDIPVIGSLNGVSPGGWMRYAQKMEEAGVDGLELNIYYIPTDPNMTSEMVENIYLADLKTVKSAVSVPVAMKLNPYFSAFANMAARLDKAGADALVLFNRFYQPDIDLETLEVIPNLRLSHPYEIRLPMRWTAILYGSLNASLAVTSGVHHAEDVIKLVMAGADVTMMASVLLKEGPSAVKRVLKELEEWMETHEYESIEQMKGSMSYRAVAEPAALVRSNYIKTLQSVRL